MKLHQNSTQKLYKQGNLREDGWRFWTYRKNKAGETTECWVTPEAFVRARISTATRNAAYQAKDKNLPFDLTPEYLQSIFPKDNKCPIFGIEFEWGEQGGATSSPSLDRIHPALGYVKGNVIWISMYANRLKQDHSLDTLRTLLAFYENLERRE